jgi:hypothetical protein
MVWFLYRTSQSSAASKQGSLGRSGSAKPKQEDAKPEAASLNSPEPDPPKSAPTNRLTEYFKKKA